ncbi:relaxase/mobilization nuclease domain-containing protein [Bradyrhizobium iriomotense]|uniref:MobA/VirD2-like nuclease domain-containing protein n=1 Tax=Bradyrhizobium iriomotense TaxID=441950 RepID=A0ABQ6BC58_9BRAD|nr:relaxase/mobilization nuclease domain-containing protein [Bradyrhizobium iriomotense]GLR89753.1 hypothetical protein GCM10007857_64670 [Bradyrhizobium iriomotense]
MIVKIAANGASFKGRSNYLMHDPKAKTQERVEWTHTLNLANEFVPAAVNEMYITAENAEWLKQQAGIRGGGRATEKTVKHISLNWSPSDDPSKEHMIETSQKFLRHMGWQDHQAILIAHNDKAYKHVHILLNAVHPETGLRLNDDFERAKAQTWALEYEREQGRIYCEQRLKSPKEREKNMPRNVWMDFQPHEQEFRRGQEKLTENDPELPSDPKDREWKILKEIQKTERIEFNERFGSEFRQLKDEIYREVKEEFRDRWANYFKLRRRGHDHESLMAIKDELVADRKEVLETKSEFLSDLRLVRDACYRDLLDEQKEDKAELKRLQKEGLDTREFFEEQRAMEASRKVDNNGFRDAAKEVGGPTPVSIPALKPVVEKDLRPTAEEAPDAAGPRSRSRDRISAGVGSFLGALLSNLTNLGSAKPEPISKEERADQFRQAAEDALKQHQQRGRDEEDETWRTRQKEFYRE